METSEPSTKSIAKKLLFAQINLQLYTPVVLLIIYYFIIILRPQGVFWSTDEGGKLIYMQSVLLTGDPSASLIYPQRPFDPQAKFVPLYFYIRRGDEIYTWWSVIFPLISLPFYKIFGWIGLYIIPASMGAIGAWLSGKILQLLRPQSTWLVITATMITGLATPIMFYSTMFWEHTIATTCFLASIYCILRAVPTNNTRLLILAGGLASLSVAFRTEIGLMVAGIAVALFLKRWRSAFPFIAGVLVISIPWMGFNWWATGNPLNVQLTNIIESNKTAVTILGRRFIPYMLFNAPNFWAFEFDSFMLYGGTLLAAIGVITPFIKRLRWISLVAYAGLMLIDAIVLFSGEGYRSVHGILIAAPHLIFAIWAFTKRDQIRDQLLYWMVIGSVVVFGAVYILKSWVAAGGLQWGPRYLLTFFPLFVILELFGMAIIWSELRKPLQIGLLVTYSLSVMIGIGIQFRGIDSVRQTYIWTEATANELQNLKAKPILNNGCYMSMLVPDLYWKLPYFNNTFTDLNNWANLARQNGNYDFYFTEIDLCTSMKLDQVATNRISNPTGLKISDCDIHQMLAGDQKNCLPIK